MAGEFAHASFCVACGWDVKVDEDGCCATCGNGAMGPALEKLLTEKPGLEGYRSLGERCALIENASDRVRWERNEVLRLLEDVTATAKDRVEWEPLPGDNGSTARFVGHQTEWLRVLGRVAATIGELAGRPAPHWLLAKLTDPFASRAYDEQRKHLEGRYAGRPRP